MKLLFVIPYVPNPIRVRPYQFIRSLAARGHEITLVTLFSDETERQDAEAMRAFCRQVYSFPLPKWRSYWNCLWALPGADPLQAAYCWQPAAAEVTRSLAALSSELAHFDAAHVEHLRGARYALALQPPDGGSDFPPVVWDSVDSISHLFAQAMTKSKRASSRWITRFEWRRTRLYEARLMARLGHILVTSPADRAAFLGLPQTNGRAAAIHVVANGVDLDFFKPDPALAREPDTLVVSGKMSYHANVTMVLHLAHDILPRVWEKRPQTRVWIVGKEPTPEIQALANDPRVTVTGTVADIRPYLQKAAVAVAPVPYGAGIQNKVLEALACGAPVISSPQAVSALNSEAGEAIWVASQADEFADRVVALLEDETQRDRLGRTGRAYVEKFHDWDAAAAQLESIYTQAALLKHTHK